MKMDRRDTLKTLLIGSLAGAAIVGTSSSCSPDETIEKAGSSGSQELYGRTPDEIERDKRIMSEEYFNEHELATIAVLCDIILPATATASSANEAGVPEFIEFIVKDLTYHKLPMRGGLMWIDQESNNRYSQDFAACTDLEQIQIIEDIAYPDENNEKPEMAAGIKFFSLIRNLTVTGYYTSKLGFEDLGYKGNTPNVWDGVPQEVLDKHSMAYDEDWLAKCVDQSQRAVQAEWDDDMNLIS